jgi:mannosyltransferase
MRRLSQPHLPSVLDLQGDHPLSATALTERSGKGRGPESSSSSPVAALIRAGNREVRITPRVLLVSLILLGAALRFGSVNQHSIWFDEAFVAYIASKVPWPQVLPFLKQTDAHPPLYYSLIKLWVGMLGTGEAIIRLPSAAFSVLSIVATYSVTRRIGLSVGTGLLTSFLMTISPLEIMVGQEARMYALLELLMLASTLALIDGIEHRGFGRWAIYTVLSTAMAYTHYFGILIIASQGLWVMLCNRKRFSIWIASAAGVLAAYLPWIPSVWYQTVSGNGWAWYRPHLSWQVLGDLGGLYAFGGSLFGMGDYFKSTSLHPIHQLILLSPFIVLFSVGCAALWAQGRTYASLAACLLVVPIGVPLAISLTRPMFYPRWFSFLFPIYAVIVAAGVSRIGNSWNGPKDRVIAVITAGLLLYNLPTLGDYYFNPRSRPYDWRDAASLVEREVRPGDFFLYTNEAAAISFRYYFHGSVPSLVLTPVEAIPGPPHSPTFTPASARHLAVAHPRLWIVATLPFTPAMQDRLRRDLEGSFQPVGQKDFGDAWITLLRAKQASTTSSTGSWK